MAIKITKATELTSELSTFLIYANPGVGKTTAIKHFPGKKLVIDIDKSSTVLKGEPDIDVAEINTHNIWEEWTELVADILKNPNNYAEYDNIVIDNISELFRATLANLGRLGNNNRVPAQADYQRVDFTILDSLRALKGIGKRIIFTAWETTDQYYTPGGQVFNRAIPDMRMKILNNFLGLCDVVARLVVHTDEDGNEKRGFILQPSETVYAKNRLSDAKGARVDELYTKTAGVVSGEEG